MTLEEIEDRLDPATLERLLTLAATEKRSRSQILDVALKVLLDMPPTALRAIFAIDSSADEKERAFAAKHIGRAALKAYEGILDARRSDFGLAGPNDREAATQEDIEAEAVRMCRA